jgi:3-(3-hydroxy-phenyl)propionate hydroxylase
MTAVSQSARESRRPVVIVGAGPVGLITALALARQDIPVLVVECEPNLTYDLRASTLHCATLDVLHPLGVTERLLRIGYRVRYWQIRDRRGGVVAEWDLNLLADDTQFPFRLACEQHKITAVVLSMLAKLPNVDIRFNTRFVEAFQTTDYVDTKVTTGNGCETIRASWLIGGDGGRSAVRKSVGVDFEGFTWPEKFLGVSTDHDFGKYGFTYSAYVADPVEWAAVFKVPHEGPPGVWRVMFPIDSALSDERILSDEFIESLMQGFMPRPESYEIVYRNLYRVHQRVAKSFRVGRVLLVGDAAHVNNPVGALGLNSGIHDAINLAEKLTAVWRGGDTTLLDRYERQRRTTNIEYVQSESIRNKRLLEERDPKIRAARLKEVQDTAADRKTAREYLLRSSMITSLRQSNAIA